MIAGVAAGQADPNLGLIIALVGVGAVAIGAVLTGAFALISSKLTEARAHERWKRTERHAALVAYLREVDRTMLGVSAGHMPGTAKEIVRALQPLADAIASVSILGPESAIDAANVLRTQVAASITAKEKTAGFDDARVAFVVAVRRVLHIDPEADAVVKRSDDSW